MAVCLSGNHRPQLDSCYKRKAKFKSFSHGSGGLAGQYRFGARSEVSIIILGLCKLLLGIIFGGSLVGLLKLFPTSLLSVMLFVSGLEVSYMTQFVLIPLT